jgi:hypothetical protein
LFCKCWFPAGGLRRGREKPLEELRWQAEHIVPMTIPAVSIMAQEPSEFDLRWKGEDVISRSGQ